MDSPDEEEPDHKFNLFVKYTDRSNIGIFTTANLTADWSLCCEYPLDFDIVTMQSIPLNGRLFTLSYAREPDSQAFVVRLAIDSFAPYATLSNPPVMLKQFSICGLNNNMIFAHDCIGEYEKYTEPIPGFSTDQITRAIYAYNCDTDTWLPVPAMSTPVLQCILASDSNRVYAVGGRCGKTECRDATHGHVQAYDCRADEWQILPQTESFYSSCFGATAVFNGKLFVVSSDHDMLEVYDLTAGRWFRHQDKHVVRDMTECQCGYAYGILYPYGRCCLRVHENILYKFGLGTQENPIWELNQVGCYFLRVSLLHERINKIKQYSDIYDVVHF